MIRVGIYIIPIVPLLFWISSTLFANHQLSPDEMRVKTEQKEIGNSSSGFTVASVFVRDSATGINTITNRAVTSRHLQKKAIVKYLSAAGLTPPLLLTSDNPREKAIYAYGSLLNPRSFDAASLPGIRHSVEIIADDQPVDSFSAPAYIPLTRVTKEWVIEVLKHTPIEKAIELYSIIKGIRFSSKVIRKHQSFETFEYTYTVENNSNELIFFVWASTANKEFPNGLKDSVKSKDKFTLTIERPGIPFEIVDVAVFNNKGLEALPQLKRLEILDDIETRILEVFKIIDRLTETGSGIIFAPAFVPPN